MACKNFPKRVACQQQMTKKTLRSKTFFNPLLPLPLLTLPDYNEQAPPPPFVRGRKEAHPTHANPHNIYNKSLPPLLLSGGD